jgi:hypothetical protein
MRPRGVETGQYRSPRSEAARRGDQTEEAPVLRLGPPCYTPVLTQQSGVLTQQSGNRAFSAKTSGAVGGPLPIKSIALGCNGNSKQEGKYDCGKRDAEHHDKPHGILIPLLLQSRIDLAQIVNEQPDRG